MADGDRSFLGLTHNPFVEPFRGFFERGGRKSNLEQLRHLSQWSRRVLLVTGPQGVGKTTLYRELAATLEPRVKAARISAGLVNNGREVLAAIAQGFGIAALPRANSQTLRFDLIQHVETLAAGDRPCLVVVDDAQLLDNRAVDELITLTHESALHLVLFGEVRMVPVIERAASSKGVGWQEIRLSAYGDSDARDYLEWRFQQARYRGRIPFTDQQVKDLVKLSGGLPGRINQMANVLLVKLETGELSTDRGRFPKMHLAMLALLVVMIGVLYVLTSERPSHVDTVALTLPPPSDEASGSSAGSRPAAGAATADRTRTGGVDTAPAEPVSVGSSEESPVADAEPPSASEEPAAAGQPSSSQSEATSPASSSDGSDVSGPVAEDVDGAAARPEPEPAASAAPAEGPADVRPEAAEPPAPVTAPAAGAAEATPASRARDTRWLLRQNPQYYTLQLVTVSALERADAFVSRQQEPGEFAIYQLQRNGRILHVVTYGLFSTREAAQAAADHLPAEVGDVQPWIRPVAQVQNAARQSTLQ